MAVNQTEINRRNSARRLAAAISNNFGSAQLLTFHYALGVNTSRRYLTAQFENLMHFARSVSGGAFRYVQITEYCPATSQVVFLLIVDLPLDICREITSRWFMGKATVKRQTSEELAALAGSFIRGPWNTLEKNHKSWSTSRGLAPLPPS